MIDQVFEKLSLKMSKLGFNNFNLKDYTISFDSPPKDNGDYSTLYVCLGDLPSEYPADTLDLLVEDICNNVISDIYEK